MKNIDTEEIAHFAALANHWWDVHGPLRTLHDINPTRLAFIAQHTKLNDKNILDVGCGGGILSEALAKAGAHVTGIDQEPHAIQVAINHAKKSNLNIHYQCISVETLVEESQKYDMITCMEMLEHVPYPAKIIQSCVQLLKPQGKLFLSTINRTLKAYALTIVGAEYILNLIPKHTHQYERFIRPSEMAEWLRQKDFDIKAFSGLHYNPCTHSASLTDDLTMNYLAVAQRDHLF